MTLSWPPPPPPRKPVLKIAGFLYSSGSGSAGPLVIVVLKMYFLAVRRTAVVPWQPRSKDLSPRLLSVSCFFIL
jgi:hypothetical protein